MKKNIRLNCIIIGIILFITSCVQVGPKIVFRDDEWLEMREREGKRNSDWNTMLDEYHDKWEINGLRLHVGFRANHTVFSGKEPYYIEFSFEATKNAKNKYKQFTVKDVKINNIDGKSYQYIVDRYFPVTKALKEYFIHDVGGYKTEPVFKFSFEKLILNFTVEVESTDTVESKTFEYHVSPIKNPPDSFFNLFFFG